MIRLNIIPEKQKREVRLKAIYDHLKNFFEFIFFIFIIFIISFLIMKLILANHFITTVENTTMLTKNAENYSKKVSDINSKLSSMTIIQKDFVYWSKLIEKIRSNQPLGLNLEKISINKSKNQILFTGVANKRDDLLEFKSNLEKMEYFNTINLPIKNLLQKENISFNIAVEIKLYEY